MSERLNNEVICQETELKVILRAELIPDRATVTKVNGEARYILRHSLMLYGKPEATAPIKIDGLFLVSPRGDINQVTAGKLICWCVTAEDLVDNLQRSWEPLEQ